MTRYPAAAVALVVASTLPVSGKEATSPVPVEAARVAIAEARLACEEDGGALWGHTLCGPLILVDPASRFAVASQGDSAGTLKPADGVFVGTLPPEVVIANTAVDWAGARWTMVMWGAVGPRPVQQRRLLMHESFHRIQPDLGLPAENAMSPHLDALEGRYDLLLELRALAAALRAPQPGHAVADALAFRGHRRSLFPGAAALEQALEANEGLAEYTGWALRGTSDEETRLALARRLDDVDRDTSFVRSFAYFTGPAYGLLLDAASPGWRSRWRPGGDLADALAGALGVAPASGLAARRGVYDDGALRRDEEARARQREATIRDYRSRLVDGPRLEIPLDGANYGFDPNAVLPLDGEGSVFPSLSVSGPWGTLETDNGALFAPARGVLVVQAADRLRLRLNPGWSLVPGDRPGDLRLAPAPAP